MSMTMTMAATRTVSSSPPLLLATLALSSSWIIPVAETFAVSYSPRQRRPELVHRRGLHLPPRRPAAVTVAAASSEGTDERDARQSVTGSIYEREGVPTVKLFTKQGCTLCDQVKEILASVQEDQPHSLYAVDITDDDKQDWFSKYKYDIPVLHINDVYWTKHTLSPDDAVAGIQEAGEGDFMTRRGEPDASRLERN